MIFVAQASFTLVTPFLPYVLRSMNVQSNLALWSGLAYSASFLTQAVMAPVWGSLADKYGKRLQILRSGIGIAITYYLYPAARTPLQFVIMRGVTGILSGFTPAATSLVATNTPEDKIGYALGLFQATAAAGTISGPLLGGMLVSLTGISSTFRLAALVLIVVTVLSFVNLEEEVNPSECEIDVVSDIRRCISNKKILTVFACLFLVQAGIQVTQPTLVLYVELLSHERNPTFISGLIYSMAGLGTVLGASLAARKTDGNDRDASPRLFVLGLLGSSVFVALQGVFLNLVPLSIFRLAFGAFNGVLTVSGNVLAAKAVQRDFRGRAFGVLNGVLPMGSVVGPLLGGAVGDSLGLGSTFYASSMVFALSGTLFALYMKRAHEQGYTSSW